MPELFHYVAEHHQRNADEVARRRLDREVVCIRAALLKERGKTTRELQKMLGLSRTTINRAAAVGRQIMARFG